MRGPRPPHGPRRRTGRGGRTDRGGGTGYVGGRLIGRLLDRDDVDIRVLVRDRDRAVGREWASRVELVEGDLLDPESLRGALAGVDAAP